MSKSVLVIAAHPDDEILGCGGTMAKHIQQGDQVHVCILAEGITSRDAARNVGAHTEQLSQLAAACKKANAILGVNSVELWDFPDNRMDTVPLIDVIKKIEAQIEQHQPDVIYTHHVGDVNIDHQITHQAVVTACRPMPGKKQIARLLFFEVASSTEWQTPYSVAPFLPNWFENISNTLTLKLRALSAYDSEMRAWPHARSILALEHLAKWRGATIGVDASEAFMVGRCIHD